MDLDCHPKSLFLQSLGEPSPSNFPMAIDYERRPHRLQQRRAANNHCGQRSMSEMVGRICFLLTVPRRSRRQGLRTRGVLAS
jgi:hypothetical protein